MPTMSTSALMAQADVLGTRGPMQSAARWRSKSGIRYLEWTNRVAVRPPNIWFVTKATLPVAMPTWTAWLVYCQRTGVSSTSVNACQNVFATLGTFANSETEFACLPTTGRSLRSHSNNNNGERQNSSNRCMRYLRHLHLRHLRAPSGTRTSQHYSHKVREFHRDFALPGIKSWRTLAYRAIGVFYF
jgi:hypothetical protein